VDPTKVLPIVSLGSLVTVEYGGWALLSFLTARQGLTEPQTRFFRAGHAHAGVLLVLSLVFFVYLDRTDFGDGTQWAVGLVLLAGILAQSGGFFLHLALGARSTPSLGTRVTRAGALLIAVALVTLAVGIARS
jgi:hypothetical protein